MTSSFKAYIDVNEYDSQNNCDDGESDGFDAKDELKLLAGEVVVSSAEKVLKFTALSEQRQGISGGLFVTNYKISFVTADRSSFELVDRSLKNKLLGECDICLANVDSVYQILESNGRKKKLLPGSNVNTKIQSLQIHCKDFRTHTFSFKFTPRGQEKAVVNALMHHSFPPRPQLLFAFEYKGPVTNAFMVAGTPLYLVASDWQQELKRLQCEKGWRVSHVNETYMMSRSLPETFVVPNGILDEQLAKLSTHCRGNRVPVWSWSLPDGGAIVRSADIHPGITESKEWSVIQESIKYAHPSRKQPRIVDLDTLLPNLKDIQQSYLKLRDLCVSDSTNQFWEQDARYYSHLENTKWLSTVAACLNIAKQLTSYVYQYQVVVILQEQEGKDLSCLISSIMQIILDAHYRSITGFQTLIQKEWVALGHPFSDRLRHLRGTENEECPVFLLFLDCVWQMLQQFPAEFEFTEMYLTSLWDCTHLSIFDTFLFNSPRDQRMAKTHHRLQTRSLWEWNQLFTRDEMAIFQNPLYSMLEKKPDIALASVGSKANSNAGIHRHGQENSTFPRNSARVSRRMSDEDYDLFDLHANTSTQRHHHSTSKISASVMSTALTSEKSKKLMKWTQYRVLPINPHSCALQVWAHCYFRWNPLVQIFGGGSPIAFIERCRLIKDIAGLQERIAAIGDDSGQSSASSSSLTTREPILPFLPLLSPTQLKQDLHMTSAFPYSPGGAPSMFGLPVTFYRQSSYVASDDESDDGHGAYDD